MTYRTRQVLPPRAAIAAFIVPWLVLETISHLCPEAVTDSQRLTLVVIGSVFYGGYRAMAFHPLPRREYGQWLATTPWTARMPLPLGPIHLVWQDAILLAFLAVAAARIAEQFWAVPMVAFLVGYLFPLAIYLMLTGAKGYGWGILFSLGLALTAHDLGWALGVCVVAYLVAYLGIRRSLEQFPWPGNIWSQQSMQPGYLSSNPDATKDRLGWPYSRLQPFAIEPAIPTRTALALSLLAAWYLYAIATAFGTEARDTLYVAYGVSVGVFPIGRTLVYLAGIRPPISMLGRLFTGRIIIPGFDRVFVAPLAALVFGLLIPPLLHLIGAGPDISVPIAVGGIAWITLSWGLTLAEWRLTGSHRLVSPAGNATQYAKI